MQKFVMPLTPCLGCPLCGGNKMICPIPSPFPPFSPMGRLLSSWPAHGEKRGRGEGMGTVFLCAHDSLSGLGTVFFCGHRNLYLGVPPYNDWIMHKFLMALTTCLVCTLCVGSKSTAPSPPPFPFSHPWAGC